MRRYHIFKKSKVTLNSFSKSFLFKILAMVEEAAGTRMYEVKRQAAQKTIDKKDAKLLEFHTVHIYNILNEFLVIYITLDIYRRNISKIRKIT